MRRLSCALAFWLFAGIVCGQTGEDSLLLNGRLAYQEGNYSKAIIYYRQYLKWATDSQNRSAQADSYRLIGDALRALGELPEAVAELNMGLEIARAGGDSAMVGRIYNRISAVRFEMTDMNGSEAAANDALDRARKVQDRSTESSTLNILGAIYRQNKKPQLALEALGESASIQRMLGDTSDVPNALNNMANTLITIGDFQAAADTALHSYRMAKAMKILVYQQYASLMLFESYHQSGQLEEAIKWLQIYNGHSTELLNETKGKEIATLKADIAFARKEQENQSLKVENERQTLIIDRQNARAWAVGSIGALVLLITTVLAVVAQRQRRTNASLKEKNLHIEQQSKEISAINDRLRRVAAEQAFQKARLEEINQMKDKLFSIISHDLRSPMNSIQGLLQLMSDGKLTTQQFSKMADTLHMRVDGTTLLLDNLLHWSRSQMEGFSIATTSIDMGDVIAQVCNMLDPSAKAKSIAVRNQVNLGTTAYGDRPMLELVLRNLLSNAIKFTENAGKIEISAVREPDGLRINIVDNGIGIDPADVSLVMGMDYFHTPGTNSERGSGLGLRLAREFIAKNEGKIGLTHNLDKGTTFWILLKCD